MSFAAVHICGNHKERLLEMLFSHTREDIKVNKIPMLHEKPKRLIYISLASLELHQ